MKAVLLAAGQSSRLFPFSQNTHKSMVEIMGKPLLEYTINELKNAGIKDLIIVINKDSGVRVYFEDGRKFGVSIKYIIQDNALGMGNALLLAKGEIDSDFLLLNAYHFDVGSFVKEIIRKKSSDVKAVLLAKRKNSILGQGVLKVDGKKIIEIVEKPPLGKEPSNLCVVGIYLLSKDFIKTLVDTPQEQYQFEKALTVFSQRNTVTYLEIKENTVSLKYPWDLLSIKNYLLKNIKRNISKTAKISQNAELIGEVVVSENANIMEGVRIKGPCFIGKNVIVGNNSLLRDGVVIEDNCSVGAFIEIKNTLFMENSKAHSGFIGDTVIGSNVRIGAQFCTGNVRLDRKNIEVLIKEEKVGSSLKSLGTFIGDNVRIGVKSTTMPGIIIGNNSIIGPSTTVLSNVSENTRYYTKFLEIVKKDMTIKKTIVLFDIDYTLFDTKTFVDSGLKRYALYDETLPTIKRLSKSFDLGIFSKGGMEFQNNKLDKTGLRKYFKGNNVYIFEDKNANLKDVLFKYRNSKVFLVDDKLPVLYEAKLSMFSIITIWIKRGPFAENQKSIKNFSPDITVNNLVNLSKIVENN